VSSYDVGRVHLANLEDILRRIRHADEEDLGGVGASVSFVNVLNVQGSGLAVDVESGGRNLTDVREVVSFATANL
jgi:hypothetical protein